MRICRTRFGQKSHIMREPNRTFVPDDEEFPWQTLCGFDARALLNYDNEPILYAYHWDGDDMCHYCTKQLEGARHSIKMMLRGGLTSKPRNWAIIRRYND